jgi:hypothetical protein
MPPPPAPVDAFQALSSSATAPGAPKKSVTLPADMMEKLKELLVANPLLSRVGTIELFNSQHTKCSKAAIKAALDLVAEKAGKSWKLKGGAIDKRL